MKNLNEIAFIVQARLNSKRVPQKMIRPFAGDTLFGIVLDKLLDCKNIPNENIFASVFEDKLIEIVDNKPISYFVRSKESAEEEDNLQLIYEWHDKLPAKYKYVILISGCNPLLKKETIDGFVEKFVTQEKENLFAVIEKRQYFWNKEGKMINDWPEGETIMNTKVIEPTYEAAHCLYASRLDTIKNNKFMVDYSKENLTLYTIPELESFDIDYEWQFKTAELLYEKI
jgi:CMP-N-acetylneuraminic acid synthetase